MKQIFFLYLRTDTEISMNTEVNTYIAMYIYFYLTRLDPFLGENLYCLDMCRRAHC